MLLVRIDNRVGEALLTTPLLSALAERRPDLEVDLLVHPRCVRVLDGVPGVAAALGVELPGQLGVWGEQVHA